jgi:aryl-alcohol dehydrogenase-like predicted oxidoreductase
MWGKHFEQEEVDAIFGRAVELGINFVDTAECYGSGHLSERFIGNAIRGNRERWLIATKFGHNPDNDLGDENFGPEQVLIQLEESLRALRTDYIDVYQLHSAGDAHFDNDALWTMLDKQVQAGKVRFLGNSVGGARVQHQVARSREYGISVIQTPYNALQRNAAEDVFPLAEAADLGVIARAPLAMGLLSGKYRPGHAFGDVRAMFLPQKHVDEKLAAADEFLRDKPADVAPATWANAWCLRDARVGTVIPGIKTVAQLEVNAQAGR